MLMVVMWFFKIWILIVKNVNILYSYLYGKGDPHHKVCHNLVKSIVCSMHRINIGFSCNYQNLNILILNGTKVHDKKCKRYKRKKKLNRICGQIWSEQSKSEVCANEVKLSKKMQVGTKVGKPSTGICLFEHRRRCKLAS